MTKRTFDEIKTILGNIDDEDTLESLSQYVKEKRAKLAKETKKKNQKQFLKDHGYLVSINEIDKLRIDDDIICLEIPIAVECTSWNQRDHSDAEISCVSSDDALYKYLKLYDVKLSEILDADDLNWSMDTNFIKDDWDDPFHATVEDSLWFYTKKQPVPTISEPIFLLTDSDEIIECVIQNDSVVEKESCKEIVKLEEWNGKNYFNLKKLTIGNPFK